MFVHGFALWFAVGGRDFTLFCCAETVFSETSSPRLCSERVPAGTACLCFRRTPKTACVALGRHTLHKGRGRLKTYFSATAKAVTVPLSSLMLMWTRVMPNSSRKACRGGAKRVSGLPLALWLMPMLRKETAPRMPVPMALAAASLAAKRLASRAVGRAAASNSGSSAGCSTRSAKARPCFCRGRRCVFPARCRCRCRGSWRFSCVWRLV